ncbi:uncharacterized protein E0L32_008666 [Thyridium curvatum]|uniref:Uncharacterized protein n=1 Tax=Thyridium curvatum TaxID=1093900 RepID=A0A507ASK9_9PEZI|nr:uncharacterized protein E0L32_008666 [Thyridium curvatum]TPX10447.1 hypothetical protein E0L32_008666 [Thyridium curvatum]
MVRYALVAFAGLAAALPLNINLGAYSPALVVGDGEISFGGRQDVSNLMNALEGAAVNAAGQRANTNGAAAPETPAAQPPAAVANAADPSLQEQAQQIASLQGLGKEIAPRVAVEKRDLTGFDRALKFAEVALEKGPKVQLGTGAEGSGVGIIVDNNKQAAARPGKGAEGEARPAPAAPAAPGRAGAAEKRDVVTGSEAGVKPLRTRVTTMYVRSGVPASMQGTSNEARSVAAAVPRAAGPVSAPISGRSDTIDSLNLNVDGDQGITMTFVEQIADDNQ